MKRRPSRFRRLDGALADLPVEEPMLLTELDGFLTGLVIGPEVVPAEEWMTVVWGMDADDIPPFDDPLDVQWFAGAVTARRDEIVRDLGRGKLQPILDIDESSGEILWEYWIDGLAEAIALRPQAWDAFAGRPATAAAWSRLTTLIAVAREDSDLDSLAINALQDRAVVELTEAVRSLYAARIRVDEPMPAPKAGRNDPCPCGSGRKHKHCCS